MTLLLGPPGAGKTTLLKALAGKLQRSPDLKVHHDELTSHRHNTAEHLLEERAGKSVALMALDP
jgi:ABC-type multidrug transport system ATPase subunit